MLIRSLRPFVFTLTGVFVNRLYIFCSFFEYFKLTGRLAIAAENNFLVAVKVTLLMLSITSSAVADVPATVGQSHKHRHHCDEYRMCSCMGTYL